MCQLTEIFGHEAVAWYRAVMAHASERKEFIELHADYVYFENEAFYKCTYSRLDPEYQGRLFNIWRTIPAMSDPNSGSIDDELAGMGRHILKNGYPKPSHSRLGPSAREDSIKVFDYIHSAILEEDD